MNAIQIFFASPSGDAIVLSVQRKRASVPSNGMYRAEIDARRLASEQSATDLLDSCLKTMKGTDCMLVGVNASPKIAFDVDVLSRVGENKGSVIYHAKGGLTRDALESLASISYGEFFVIGYADMESMTDKTLIPKDIDDALSALDSNADWAIGYDAESAVLTVLARERSVVKEQIVSALEFALNGT